MGFTFIASAAGNNDASGTTLDCTSALNVQAGDLLIALCAWSGGVGSGFQVADTDGSTNLMTALAECDFSAHDMYGRIAYKLAADADASATFRLTFSSARIYRYFRVLQYRPDSGDVVSLASGPSPANGTTSPVQTGNLSAVGTDMVAAAFASAYNESAWSAQKIGELDASVINTDGWFNVFHRTFTADQTDIHAQVNQTGATYWLTDFAIFKAVSGGTSYTLTCGAGAFALTGQAAALKASRHLALSPGALSLSGQSVGLHASHRISAGAGVFVLTGQAVDLKATLRLSAAPGAFALSGIPALLRRAARLVLGPGAFALTGQDVELRLGEEQESESRELLFTIHPALAISRRVRPAAEIARTRRPLQEIIG